MKKRKKRLTDLEFERNWWRAIADDFSHPVQLNGSACSASYRLGICDALTGLEVTHNSLRAIKTSMRCRQAIKRAFATRLWVPSQPFLFPKTLEGARQRVDFCKEQARRCTEQIRKKKAK